MRIHADPCGSGSETLVQLVKIQPVLKIHRWGPGVTHSFVIYGELVVEGLVQGPLYGRAQVIWFNPGSSSNNNCLEHR